MGAFIDLTGQKFGMLTVISRGENQGRKCRWNCICNCGKTTTVLADSLRSGNTISCGCRQREHRQKMGEKNFLDITGHRYGKLVIISRAGSAQGNALWNCLCDCGNETVVASHNLRKKDGTVSCGCYRIETLKKTTQKNVQFALETKTTRVAFSQKLLKNNTSGFKGVSLNKGWYLARIEFQKNVYYLGRYRAIEEAIAARKLAESMLWGDFALNIKEEYPELAEKIEKILKHT